MDFAHLLQTRERAGRLESTGREVLPHTFQRRVESLSCWVPRLQRVRTLEGHRGCVNTIRWSPNGNFLISGSDDTKLKIWDMTRMRKRMTLSPGHSANVFCALFLPRTDEEQVVSCGADGNIIVTHVPRAASEPRAQVRHLFTCHNNIVNRIVVDPNGANVYFSCGDDGTVRRFDRRARHECKGAGEECEDNVFINLTAGDKYANHNVGLNALSIDPTTGLHIATAGSDPFIRLYDVRNPTEPFRVFRPSWRSEEQRKAQRSGRSLYMSHPHLTSLAFDRTGTELLASYGGDYIYLLSLAGGTEGVAAADRMEVEGGPELELRGRSVSPTRPPREDEADGGGNCDLLLLRSPASGGKRKRKSDEARMEEEEEDDEDGKNGEDDDDDDDENDSEEEVDHDHGEEEDDDDGEEDGDEDEDDDDDEEDPWELEDEAASELEEDPRIRNPDVSIDYERQWKGHLNVRTIKEVNYFGPNDQYIISGSDDGHIFIWEKQTGKLVQLLKGDAAIVNCVQGHPLGYPTLAASGLGHDIKVFMPVAKSACCLDHAQQVMDKNTNTLEHGRGLTQSALTEEMMQRLVAIMQEEDPEAEASQNCVLS